MELAVLKLPIERMTIISWLHPCILHWFGDYLFAIFFLRAVVYVNIIMSNCYSNKKNYLLRFTQFSRVPLGKLAKLPAVTYLHIYTI